MLSVRQSFVKQVSVIEKGGAGPVRGNRRMEEGCSPGVARWRGRSSSGSRVQLTRGCDQLDGVPTDTGGRAGLKSPGLNITGPGEARFLSLARVKPLTPARPRDGKTFLLR